MSILFTDSCDKASYERFTRPRKESEWIWSRRVSVWWPSHSIDKALALGLFMTHMANRLIMGVFRYDNGKPLRAARYLTRLQAEVDAYTLTGNQEHLVNAANYCFLEREAPEHQTPFWRVDGKSATRDKLGMTL